MARRLSDGSIELTDGRIVYANSLLLAQDILEIIPLFTPPPAWPFVSGGGGGGGGVGPQGAVGSAGSGGSGIDLYAATRIVSLIPGDGTDLTIDAAIAALPAEGGKIFLKQGVYNVSATLVLPDAKSVMIAGAGKGSTIINLTTNAIALFQIGAAATGNYSLRDFTATGAGTGQIFLDDQGNASAFIENVDISAFLDIVDAEGDPEISFRSCEFTMPNVAGTSFWRGSIPDAGELTWLNVGVVMPHVSNSAIDGSPVWHVTDSYVGGPTGQSIYGVGVIVWQGFNLDKAIIIVSKEGSRVVNLRGSDVTIKVRAKNFVIANSLFSNFATIADHIRVNDFAAPGITDIVVTGCTFDGGTISIRGISMAVVDGFVVEGCTFKGFTNESILVAGSKGTVTGCRFKTPGSAITEDMTSEVRYSDCDGLRGSSIAGANSVIDQDNYRNVRTWGAVGDGVTDDSGAIQVAVDALPPEGGVVYFPPGRYLLGSSISLPDKPIMVQGAGSSVVTPVGASVIDLGGSGIPAFVISAASFLQSYVVRDLGFLGTGVAGQHAFLIGSEATVVVEDCEMAAIDTIFNCTDAPSCELRNSLVFPATSIFQGIAGGVLNITDCLIFVSGTVGVSGDPSVRILNTNINAFSTFTMDLGGLSVMNATRVSGATVNSNGGASIFQGYSSDSSLLDLKTDDNVVSGGFIVFSPVGVQMEGNRNSVVGVRFSAVGIPISEVGTADFNLFDAINGFAGSVVTGGSSVTGTVIP